MELKEILVGIQSFSSNSKFNVPSLAAKLNCSVSWLREFCAANLQRSPRELIEMARLTYVLSQLNPTVNKLEPLWRAAGFSDSQTFRRALRRQTGLRPQELLTHLQTPGGPTRESIIRKLWQNDELYRLFMLFGDLK